MKEPNGPPTYLEVRSSATVEDRAEDMDKGGESDKPSGAVRNRAVDEHEPPAAEKSGDTSDRPSATTVELMVDKRGKTGDGGPEVEDKNGSGSDMPTHEVDDDDVVSEGRNKIFRLEGAVYSIGK